VSGFSFSHLSGPQVLDGYFRAKASKRASDAVLLAYVAEIDSSKLFLDAGYPSMHAFCVGEFDATHDEAKNRIRAARTALKFPAMFPMLSDGRLQLSAVLALAPHVHPGNVDELLAAVANKNKMDVQRLLAARFPRTELMSWTMGPSISGPADTTPIPAASTKPAVSASPDATTTEQKPETAGVPERPLMATQSPASEAQPFQAPSRMNPAAPPTTRVTPIAANAHGVQFMMDDEARDDLEYLRAALGHEAPTDAHVFARALKALRREVDRRRSAATERPQRPRRHASANPRHVPNHVRRAVWKRDQSQCSFVSGEGRRCNARSGLELDHIVPVARGGKSTVDNLRLLCRAHNQHAADREFGVAFMNGKREAAQRGGESRRAG
jgi:5-methylcytosine-specific restriction endonuclease McrA